MPENKVEELEEVGQQIEELGISSLIWQESSLYFFVKEDSPMSIEDIVKFCEKETHKKCSTNNSSNAELKVAKADDEDTSSFAEAEYFQSLTFEGNTYNISGCAVSIMPVIKGMRHVISSIVPSNCLIEYPSPEWLEDATEIFVTRGYSEDPFQFPLDFLKHVKQVTEEEGEEITRVYDVHGNVLERSCF